MQMDFITDIVQLFVDAAIAQHLKNRLLEVRIMRMWDDHLDAMAHVND